MKWAILLSIFISGQTSAQECVPIEKNIFSDLVNQLLDWHGASDKKVMNAPCKVKSPPNASELNQYIKGKAQGSKNASIHGTQFKNESPALINAFKDFTTAKDQMGFYANEKNQKNLQKEFKINPECDKVMCAMEKIWGKELAAKMMYVKLKHNFNTSELAFNNSDRFTVKELDDVIIGIEDLPASLQPLGNKNQRLTHFTRGYTLAQYDGDRVVANAVVMLFDSWDSQSSPSKQYTIFHEMAHNVSNKLKDMDASKEWLQLSGWVQKGDDWTSSSKACFISKYGKANAWEDYAESLSTYRYNAKYFKSTCPEKYAFIKDKVFKGLEYTDEKLCSPIPLNKVAQVKNKLSSAILNLNKTSDFSEEEINKECVGSFTKFPISDEESASCALSIISKKIPSEIVSQAFNEAGVSETSFNREFILGHLAEEFQNDSESMAKLKEDTSSLKIKVEASLEKSFQESNPVNFPSDKLSYQWGLARQECSTLFFSDSKDALEKCELESIIKKDRNMQSWGHGVFSKYTPPKVFSAEAEKDLIQRREEVLLEHLMNQPEPHQKVAAQRKEFTEHMGYHKMTTDQNLGKIDNWKKLSPEEFCQKTYGGGSSWTNYYGVSEGTPIPKVYDQCISLQSQKSKRFKLKDKDWETILSSL